MVGRGRVAILLAPIMDTTATRTQGRKPDQLRAIKFTRAFTETPGSVLAECGKTRVLCTVTVEERVPQWMYGKPGGWLTAEYAMLPGSGTPRKPRDGRTGRPIDGRSQEIQRLVGRALRCAMDLQGMPECTLWIDCDVISADGGTRTTAINGSMVALYDALLWMEEKRLLKKWPLRGMISAVSVGLVNQVPMIDLDYSEDSTADVDMNVVCSADGRLIEVQSTAEQKPITFEQFQAMLDLARVGCTQVHELQKKVLGI